MSKDEETHTVTTSSPSSSSSSRNPTRTTYIPIGCENEEDDDIPIWAMIEVNGELLPPRDENCETSNNNELIGPESIELGAVHFVDKTPVMIVGTHELKGSVENLAQPFCVLQKCPDAETNEYKITGLVDRKIVFNQYPKTIMR